MLWGYTARNLWERRSFVLPTSAAIALSVGAVTVMAGMMAGIRTTIHASAGERSAVVTSEGSINESFSFLGRDVLPLLGAAPAVEAAEGRPLISPEVLAPFELRTVEDGTYRSMLVRAVEPAAYGLHRVRLREGRLPRRGEPGLVVGANLHGRFHGLGAGEPMEIGAVRWPVLGVMEGGGTRFDSEVWCDLDALAHALRRETLSIAYVRLREGARAEDLRAQVARAAKVDVRSETEHLGLVLSGVASYERAIAVLGLLLGIGALFATLNALHALILARAGELATLLALGFTRRQVAGLLVQEALLLAAGAGALGVLGARAFHGASFSYSELSLVYRATISPGVALLGAGAALAIGLLGGLLAVLQARRIQVLDTLRG